MLVSALTWQITYVTWVHLLTALISLQLVLTVSSMKLVKGRIPFIWMLSTAAVWSLILCFESAAPTISWKVFFSELEYFCNMTIPVFFLLFIMAYSLEKPVFFQRYLWLFWIIPVIVVALVFTNDHHHLIWTGFTWSPAGANILVYHHGPAFYIASFYSLCLVVAGNLFLVSFIRKRPRYFKRKAGFLIAGSLFPLLTSLAYACGLSPVEGLDISPVGLVFSGLIFFMGIARGQLFDIVPAGHQLMIEKMNDGAIVLDNGQFVMDINPIALKSLRITENIIGRKLDLEVPALRSFTSEIDTATEIRKEFFLETPVYRWFEIMSNPLKDFRNRSLGSLLILHDITQRKESELELKKLADELTEMNATKDRLYSIIGHDLRSPFNTILGFSELLSESYDELTDEERKQFASNISISSKSAYNLLENLLEWSRIQLGRTSFTPEIIELSQFVDETLPVLLPVAQNKGITLVNRIPAGQMVYADRNMLNTILRNLISNGIKFSFKGGSVEITSSPVRYGVEISVTDQGVGIPEDILQKLFRIDNLISVPGTSNEKGTGLGLILCKEFLMKHGGTVRVESESGKGSRFILYFPGIT